MEEKAGGGVSEELEKRLDDLFGTEKEETPGQDDLDLASPTQDSPLRNLKGIVLSIDWEITDRTMKAFLEEVDALRMHYQGEKIPDMFLRLLAATGRYVRTQKARAHPDAVGVLTRVYAAMEKVLLDQDMPEAEKRRRLYRELNRFKDLKRQIAEGRHKGPEEPPVLGTTPTATRAVSEVMPPHEAFAQALDEIKQVIKAEFQALRTEIRLWREGR
ncbi:MAG: hypothetical protein ACLFUP_07430 [Desulfobacteraceae bacterium]